MIKTIEDIKYPKFISLNSIIKGIELFLIDNNHKNTAICRTGFENIDNRIKGFYPGEFIVLATNYLDDRTSTTFQYNLMLNMSKMGEKIAIVSFKQKSEDICKELIAINGEFTLSEFWTKPEDILDKFKNSTAKIQDLNLNILSCPPIKFEKTIELIKQLKRENRIDILFIDRLQSIREYKKQNKNKTNNLWLSLKSLAIELDIPIVCISDISKHFNPIFTNIPIIDGLSYYNNLDYYADTIIYLNRLIIFSKDPEHENQATLIIAKHHSVIYGEIELFYDSRKKIFRDN